MFKHIWIIAYLTIMSNHSELIITISAQEVNFPDNPYPAPADNSDTAFGLQGRQATTLATLPGFPTLTATIPTTAPGTPIVNIVTPTTGQTCICVPTGSCTPGTGTPDGSGLIDIRIVNNNLNPVVTPAITSTIPSTAAITSCAAGLVLCCQPGAYQCGASYPPIAGAPAPAAGQSSYGEYPWQAAVLSSPGDVYLGSGVLLNNLNVLTVAHKLHITAPSTLRVRMGEWNAAGPTEPLPAQEFIVSRVFLHPNYNASNLKNDVAILRLSTAVPLGNNPAIATGCLPATSFAGSRCFVSGWGRNDFTAGTFQTIQKEVDVPILQPTQCQSQLAATRLGATFVFDATSFICAGGEPGKDACTGDGGSPLVCAIGNRWFVAGLVAWGIGCGTTNVPGVYVNVASFVPWIQTTVAS